MKIDIHNLQDYTEQELISFLKHQDDLYENDGESDLTDEMYDKVRRFAELTFSGNVYFTGVGSDTRGGKVRLAHNMSGLTQVYVGEVQRNIIPKNTYTVSEKLDGTSAQVIYDATGALQIAFSRGNGYEGADITRHIRKVRNIPQQLPVAPGETFAVRLEMVILKQDWNDVQRKFISQSTKKPYVNARACTAGVMNSSSKDDAIYEYLNGVAYTIFDSVLPKSEQFELLQSYGFNIARHQTVTGTSINESWLTAELSQYKSSSLYELDGVVVNVEHESEVSPLTAFKYKVMDDDNITIATVSDVICSISKDAYLKPTIHINPVYLNQVTISKCTGFNMKYIMDNNIQPGTTIRITRQGDVIPYCVGVHEPGPLTGQQYQQWINRILVDRYGDWEWSKNKVDCILLDKFNKASIVSNLTNVFTKLRIAHLKEGNVEKLYDSGYDNIINILNMDYSEFYTVLGEVGIKVYESMEERLNGIYWPEFVGSLNLFGRGVGRKKLTNLYDSLLGDISQLGNREIISSHDSFNDITASLIVDNYKTAMHTLSLIKCEALVYKTFDPNIGPKGTTFSGQSVVFTGVRSPEVEAMIIEQGGAVASGVSNSTTIVCAKDPSSNSGKAKKARDINLTRSNSGSPLIQILTLKELEKLLL